MSMKHVGTIGDGMGKWQAQNQQNHQQTTHKNPIFPNNIANSDVVRQAHNLKVVGSNPTPATNQRPEAGSRLGLFLLYNRFPRMRAARTMQKVQVIRRLHPPQLSPRDLQTLANTQSLGFTGVTRFL